MIGIFRALTSASALEMQCLRVMVTALLVPLCLASPFEESGPASIQTQRRQIDWMRNVFCVIACDHYLQMKAPSLEGKLELNAENRLSRKFMANLFRACLDDLETNNDLFYGLMRNPGAEAIKEARFAFYQRFDWERILRAVDLDLSPSEARTFHIYTNAIVDVREKFQHTARINSVKEKAGFDPIMDAIRHLGDMSTFSVFYVVVLVLAGLVKAGKKFTG